MVTIVDSEITLHFNISYKLVDEVPAKIYFESDDSKLNHTTLCKPGITQDIINFIGNTMILKKPLRNMELERICCNK